MVVDAGVTMTEQTPVGELERQLGSHPSKFQVAEAAVVGKNADELKQKMPELGQEDFTDPNHPQYGTVDEFGRPLPSWTEQITVRYGTIICSLSNPDPVAPTEANLF